jgi:hypothetical protein
MKNLSLKQLYDFHDKMISENYSENDIEIVNKLIVEKESELLEFTSATGGPAGALGSSNVGYGSTGIGMRTSVGPVPDQRPGFPGAIGGIDWMSSTSDDGNINVPYNPSGKNRMFQKIKDPMGKGHGARTGKKSRVKPLDLKALKNIFAKNKKSNTNTMGQSEKPKKVMNFDDFAKGEMTKVTKVKEGQAYKSTKGPKDKTVGKDGLKLTDKKESFRNKIESLLKSHRGLDIKRVGNDFEVSKDGDMLLQVMFRDTYVGIKKSGAKFTDEFEYDELGKIKSKINEIVK